MSRIVNFRTRDKKLNDWLATVLGEDVDGDCHIMMVVSNDISHKFTYYNCEPGELRELLMLANEGYLDTWLKSHINDYLEYID